VEHFHEGWSILLQLGKDLQLQQDFYDSEATTDRHTAASIGIAHECSKIPAVNVVVILAHFIYAVKQPFHYYFDTHSTANKWQFMKLLPVSISNV